MEYNVFINKLSSIKNAISKRDKKNYVNIKVIEPYLTFQREGKTQIERIKLEELYKLYTSGEELKTTVAKKYRRIQSPAIAILSALK
jgi:hypothetical protein